MPAEDHPMSAMAAPGSATARTSKLPLTLLTAVLALGVAGAVAGAAAGAGRDSFDETTSVVAVEVPVTVVRGDEPVRGLTAADFEVYDGRKEQKINGFEVVDLAAPPAAARQGKGAAAGPAAVPIAGRRHFMLLFDLSFSEPSAIARAREAAHRMIKEDIQRSDLVAVATYSTSGGPKLVLGFSPDRRQVEYAIDTLGLPKLTDRNPDPLGLIVSPRADSGGQQQTTARNDREQAFVDNLKEMAKVEARAGLEAQKRDITSLTRSLADLARVLGSVQGRKYVVYLSQGFDSSVIQGSTDQQAAEDTHAAAASGELWKINSEERFGDTKTSGELTRMLDEFRRADCAIESVDIGGLAAGGDQSPRHAGGKDSLFVMAHETGGELYQNTNDLGAQMQSLLKRTSVTYILSFQPEGLPSDGKYHPLRVKLKNDRGMRVVYRPGYYAPRPFAQRTALERQLAGAGLVLGGATGGRIATSVLAAPFPIPGQQAYVPVVVEIDGKGLLAGAKDVAQSDIYAYAIDDEGTIHDHFGQSLGLDLKKVRGTLEQGGVKFYGHLDLDPGHYVVRVLVRNGLDGETSVVAVPLNVPAFDKGEGTLLPPLVADGSNRWLILREGGGREKLRAVPFPFMNGEQPFLPAARPVVAAGGEATLVLMESGLGSGDLALEGRVFGADGAQKGGEVALRGRAGAAQGLDHLLATFKPGSLPAGDYTLVVTLSDPATKHELSSSIPFAVGRAAGGSGTR
jgi:VWFA-related protein